MKQSLFKVGETVVYRNGDKYELGVIKSVIPQEYDKPIVGSHPVKMRKAYHYDYFVLYHMGETAARTREEDLHPITNGYAFTILRRSVEYSIDCDPCRQMANTLIEQAIEGVAGIRKSIVGDKYYELEDKITSVLKGEQQ